MGAGSSKGPTVPAGPPDADTVSLYASSVDFSQDDTDYGNTTQSDSDDESDTQDDRAAKRPKTVKSVVVVPDQGAQPPLISFTDSPGGPAPTQRTGAGTQLNPLLQAALRAAIPAEVTAPPIDQHLAAQVKALWQTKLDHSRVENIVGSIHSPENCTFIKVQRTNDEVFSMAKNPVQAQDASTQKTQTYICKAASQAVSALDSVNGIAEDAPFKGEARNKMLNEIANVIMLLSHVNNKMTKNRKNKLARSIPKQYLGIKKAQTSPDSNFLFGDDPNTLLNNAKKHSYAYPSGNSSGYWKKKGGKRYKQFPKNGKGKKKGKFPYNKKGKKGGKDSKKPKKDAEQSESA